MKPVDPIKPKEAAAPVDAASVESDSRESERPSHSSLALTFLLAENLFLLFLVFLYFSS